jgi:hypothetical protein
VPVEYVHHDAHDQLLRQPRREVNVVDQRGEYEAATRTLARVSVSSRLPRQSTWR